MEIETATKAYHFMKFEGLLILIQKQWDRILQSAKSQYQKVSLQLNR